MSTNNSAGPVPSRLSGRHGPARRSIQERFLGAVAPELWAHGSSAQRMRWFSAGFETGALEDCDTFEAADPLIR